MGRKLDKLTCTLAAGLVLGALLACKKKEEPAPVVSAAPPPPAPEPPKPPEPAKPKDEVKRYGDKEIAESGTVRVKLVNTKVYKEADSSTDSVTTLNRGTLVNRKARYSNWLLVDYPSGVGELSPGWVLTAHIEDKVLNVNPDAVKKQDAGAATASSAAPTTSATAAATGTTSAAPTATATAAPTPTPTPTPAPTTTAPPASSGGRFKLPGLRPKPTQ
jgi:hypothetical protein